MNNSLGLKIIDVSGESYGAAIGLEIGDTILAYNSETLSSVDQLIGLIKQNEDTPVEYRINRNGVEKTVQGLSKTLGLTLRPVVPNTMSREAEVSSPLSGLFYFLAFLSLIGGVVMGVVFWPESSRYGRELSTIGYIYSIASFTVGVVQFALFTAIGKALAYLKQIVANTSS